MWHFPNQPIWLMWLHIWMGPFQCFSLMGDPHIPWYNRGNVSLLKPESVTYWSPCKYISLIFHYSLVDLNILARTVCSLATINVFIWGLNVWIYLTTKHSFIRCISLDIFGNAYCFKGYTFLEMFLNQNNMWVVSFPFSIKKKEAMIITP